MADHDLVVELTTDRPVGVLRLAGELFLPEVPRLTLAIVSALEAAPHRAVVCDLTSLTPPMSDYLLTVFPAALRRAGGWPHASVHLAGPSPELSRQLCRLHLQRFLPVHADVGQALTVAERQVVDAPVLLLSLDPDPGALAIARAALRDLWPGDAPMQAREEAVLVVNELTSNAIRHVAQPFTVSVAVGRDEVLLAVADPSRSEPVLRAAQASATAGRGMQVVDDLSREWGVRLVHHDGKTVWARLSTGRPASVARLPRARSGGRD